MRKPSNSRLAGESARTGDARTLRRNALQVFVAVAALIVLLPLCVGVWLPDAWSGPQTLAQLRLPSGNQFRVVQSWGSDFYTVELVQTLSDGTERKGLIDGDAAKWWRASLAVDESRHCVTVNGISYSLPLAKTDLRITESR